MAPLCQTRTANVAIGRVAGLARVNVRCIILLREIYLHATIYVVRAGIDRAMSFVRNSR